MLQNLGPPARPMVSESMIDAHIASVWYMNPGQCMPHDDYQPPVPAQHDLHRLTLCFIVLKNGFTVVGTAAVAHQENFDPVIGRAAALGDAVRQIWPLLGFKMKEDDYQQRLLDESVAAFEKGLS